MSTTVPSQASHALTERWHARQPEPEPGLKWIAHVAHTTPPDAAGARTCTVRFIGDFATRDAAEIQAEVEEARLTDMERRAGVEILATVHPLTPPTPVDPQEAQ